MIMTSNNITVILHVNELDIKGIVNTLLYIPSFAQQYVYEIRS